MHAETRAGSVCQTAGKLGGGLAGDLVVSSRGRGFDEGGDVRLRGLFCFR